MLFEYGALLLLVNKLSLLPGKYTKNTKAKPPEERSTSTTN